MTAHSFTRLGRFALAALAFCRVAAASDGIESVATVETSALPRLPASEPLVGLIGVDGRTLAVQARAAWLLDVEHGQWREASVELTEEIAAVGSDGRQAAALLRGAGAEVRQSARLLLAGEDVHLSKLPPFPFALKEALIAPDDDAVYVAGLDAAGAARLLRLSLTDAGARWSAHPGWPGGAAPGAIAAQNGALYLAIHAGSAEAAFLRWSRDKGWQTRSAPPAPLLGAARPIGQAHILYMARDVDGARLLSYHTISNAWASLPYSRARAPSVVGPWDGGVLSASANDAGFEVDAATLVSAKRLLGWLDWTTIVIYLAAMVGVGLYFHLRDKEGSASEFFVGNRAIPVWAAGVSLYATNTSSISYVAIPAKSFETNWTYLSNNLITVLGLMFVAVWIVPLLRRLDLVSVFSYLEMRFHPAIRMLASALCILMQVGSRMSVVLFLPALAIAAITGLNVVLSILLMGLCTIVYTAMGGMKAVIWTDFMQVFVMFGGALFAIFFIIDAIGAGAVYEAAAAYDKTKLFDFRFDLTQATVWGFVVLVLLDVVLTFPKDQVLMQRALATKSDRSAGRSIWIFAAMTIPGGFIFYGIGTALFAYYQARPERLDPLLPIDATFPLFIAAELPAGATGLIIAGIFAAAMSTLSSTINSVATLLTVDFYGRLARNPTQQQSLRFAEWASVVIGLIGVGLALLISRYDVHSLLDVSIELAGLLGGGFAGAYTLGMFTRRANSAGVSIGVAAAIVVTLIAWWSDLVHPYFYLGVSIFVCIVVGYCASLLFPAPSRALGGLTIFEGKAQSTPNT